MQWTALTKKARQTEKSEETVKYKKKKRYDKTIANRAPSMLIDIINMKPSYIDKRLIQLIVLKHPLQNLIMKLVN